MMAKKKTSKAMATRAGHVLALAKMHRNSKSKLMLINAHDAFSLAASVLSQYEHEQKAKKARGNKKRMDLK